MRIEESSAPVPALARQDCIDCRPGVEDPPAHTRYTAHGSSLNTRNLKTSNKNPSIHHQTLFLTGGPFPSSLIFLPSIFSFHPLSLILLILDHRRTTLRHHHHLHIHRLSPFHPCTRTHTSQDVDHLLSPTTYKRLKFLIRYSYFLPLTNHITATPHVQALLWLP